jgi:LuxR family transcriptional regulator, maltose regulon positive regulatory protein
MAVFTDQLLQTKLQRPRVPRGLVVRPRLFERLNRGVRGPLTLVSAGAGYGKTTLVSSWIESRVAESGETVADGVAWISPDEMDSDLHRFLQYLIAGVRTINAGACADTLGLLQARQDVPAEQLVAMFSNEIARLPRDFILVLDDHHAVGDADVSDFLSQLLRHWPEPMHLVLISRHDPALPLPALRAKGQLTEIRTRDLKFAAEETLAYLDQALDVPVDRPTVDRLERHVEGWIAGIQLAALSLGYTDNREAALDSLSGNETDFADYMRDEVLVHQPAPVQAFLLQTAFLDHFSTPFCNAVASIDDPEWDAQRCIEWLERRNLFIVPLDSHKEWYRYHHIFRGVLQAQAVAELGPERVSDLQRNAAAWCNEHGMTDEALRQALAAHDLGLAASSMEHGLCDVLNREDRPTLERWLHLLPPEMIGARPGLLIMKAWSLHFSWQSDALAKVLQRLVSLLEQDHQATSFTDERQIVRGQVLVLYAKVRYDANQFAGAIASCQEALTLLPERWAYVRSGAVLYQGLALQASGQVREAERLFVEGYQALNSKGGTYGLRLLLGLCCIYNNQAEDLERIRITAQRLVDGAELSGLGVMRGWGQYFLGLAHYQRNELAQAREHFVRLLGYRYTAHVGTLRDGAWRLAGIHLSMGQPTEAWQIVNILSQLDLELVGRESDETASVRARLQLMEGDLEGAARWADAFCDRPPDKAQLFMYPPHLSKARILIARGRPADVQAALDILAALDDIAERGHNVRLTIEVLVLRAIALRAEGEVSQAKEALQTAANLARPAGVVRPFVEAGLQMRDTLDELARKVSGAGQGPGEAIRWILGAFPGRRPNGAVGHAQARVTTRVPIVVPPLVESLTRREVEILILLAGPLSLKEIARDLRISSSTIKSHTLNIYAKLEVNKRRDAVARAQTLGILPSH